MTDSYSRPPPTAGFGNCRECPYLGTDSAEICYRCARQTMEPLAHFDDRCDTCDHPFPVVDGVTRPCRNPVCAMGPRNRGFQWNFAVAMRSGVIKRALINYKFDKVPGWGLIFSRILVGFLDAHPSAFDDFDAIIPSPSFVGKGSDSWDHTGRVLELAAELSPRWPFYTADPPMIRRTADTPKLSSATTYQARKAIAESDIRSALEVPDRDLVARREILVYDDVFTDGLTLREIARKLRDAGAERVCGVTLCRQAYGGA